MTGSPTSKCEVNADVRRGGRVSGRIRHRALSLAAADRLVRRYHDRPDRLSVRNWRVSRGSAGTWATLMEFDSGLRDSAQQNSPSSALYRFRSRTRTHIRARSTHGAVARRSRLMPRLLESALSRIEQPEWDSRSLSTVRGLLALVPRSGRSRSRMCHTPGESGKGFPASRARTGFRSGF